MTYQILRGGGSGQGRVFTPVAGALSYADATAVAGTAYSYLVRALKADGTLVAQSAGVNITCCTP